MTKEAASTDLYATLTFAQALIWPLLKAVALFVGAFAITSILAGIGVAFGLRRRSRPLLLLGIYSIPSQDEIDRVIARYDPDACSANRMIDWFWTRNNRTSRFDQAVLAAAHGLRWLAARLEFFIIRTHGHGGHSEHT